ncbi:MAG: hypothetical protein MZV63_06710 [Marinilabiliales bacterium]|nr:hypothetical protein [Marinilabiliales bacterium]
MIDSDGDENYQPMLIPLEGGFPSLRSRISLLHIVCILASVTRKRTSCICAPSGATNRLKRPIAVT